MASDFGVMCFLDKSLPQCLGDYQLPIIAGWASMCHSWSEEELVVDYG
jgi:hypothetical protein